MFWDIHRMLKYFCTTNSPSKLRNKIWIIFWRWCYRLKSRITPLEINFNKISKALLKLYLDNDFIVNIYQSYQVTEEKTCAVPQETLNMSRGSNLFSQILLWAIRAAYQTHIVICYYSFIDIYFPCVTHARPQSTSGRPNITTLKFKYRKFHYRRARIKCL